MQSGQVSSQGNGGTIGPTFLYSVFDSMTFFISETGTDALSILKQTYELPDGAIAMINDRHYIDAMKQCFLLHKGPLLEFSLLALEQTVEFDQLISHLSMKNTLQMLSLEMLNEDSLPLSIFSMQQLTKLSLYFQKDSFTSCILLSITQELHSGKMKVWLIMHKPSDGELQSS
ncbi:uncharacterized protein [Rutidosis leptorrhynchoides]|uniref:uncharacterized protein isoform X4 n=1 Tax=Rutidosis leptorrhynchoides TaxID=125765 RepID=UPI003A990F32